MEGFCSRGKKEKKKREKGKEKVKRRERKCQPLMGRWGLPTSLFFLDRFDRYDRFDIKYVCVWYYPVFFTRI